jgi:hypothetical protein
MGFLNGADLVWIIGILTSIIAGLNAWKKYRYEEKLKFFKETNTNLFKEEKEIVLAAISTLSIFKRDPNFENHTTNVLLSRLYTELDYDITNAICSALIQYSNREELLDISSEILDINRNFFVQEYPVKDMTSNLEKNWSLHNASLKMLFLKISISVKLILPAAVWLTFNLKIVQVFHPAIFTNTKSSKEKVICPPA